MAQTNHSEGGQRHSGNGGVLQEVHTGFWSDQLSVKRDVEKVSSVLVDRIHGDSVQVVAKSFGHSSGSSHPRFQQAFRSGN